MTLRRQAHESSLAFGTNTTNYTTQRATGQESSLTRKVCSREKHAVDGRGEKAKEKCDVEGTEDTEEEEAREVCDWEFFDMERRAVGPQVGVKEIIPGKWFGFRSLEHYPSGLLMSVVIR
jgi:hypothetical protein